MKVAIAGHSILDLTDKLKDVIECQLTHFAERGADTFYFCGTNDCFDNLCYEIIGKLMRNYEIKRVLARAYFECKSIEEDVFEYILEFTEDRTFCENLRSKKFTAYIRPFKDIIDLSDVLFTYYKEKDNRQFKFIGSAVKYAKIKRKKIINVYKLL